MSVFGMHVQMHEPCVGSPVYEEVHEGSNIFYRLGMYRETDVCRHLATERTTDCFWSLDCSDHDHDIIALSQIMQDARLISYINTIHTV